MYEGAPLYFVSTPCVLWSLCWTLAYLWYVVGTDNRKMTVETCENARFRILTSFTAVPGFVRILLLLMNVYQDGLCRFCIETSNVVQVYHFQMSEGLTVPNVSKVSPILWWHTRFTLFHCSELWPTYASYSWKWEHKLTKRQISRSDLVFPLEPS